MNRPGPLRVRSARTRPAAGTRALNARRRSPVRRSVRARGMPLPQGPKRAEASTNASWMPAFGFHLGRGRTLGHLAQPSGFNVVDEAANGVLLRDERTRLDSGDRLTYVFLEIVERLRGPLRLDPRVALDLAAEVVVAEGQHAAVGVVDEHDLLGPKQALRDRERADLVVGDDTARVPDHVRVALAQPEQPVGIQTRIHAGNDRDSLRGRQRQRPLVEALGVPRRVLEQLVDDRHRSSPAVVMNARLYKLKRTGKVTSDPNE